MSRIKAARCGRRRTSTPPNKKSRPRGGIGSKGMGTAGRWFFTTARSSRPAAPRGQKRGIRPRPAARSPKTPRQTADTPAADAPQPGKAAEGPEEKRAPEDGEERCTVDTGRVDREIEALKKQKQELERQLKAETDETKARTLQARVAQIEQELSQKDNDTYRRQHAEYSFS